MIHIHSIEYAPRPKRSDVRISERNQQAVLSDLRWIKASKSIPDETNERVRQRRSTPHYLRD